MSRTWRASRGSRVFSWGEPTYGFMDVVTGKPLSDILMLGQTLMFFSSHKEITLTKFALLLDFFP